MPKLAGDRFVEDRKVREYLLNPRHPGGASKAFFFSRFGFVSDEPEALRHSISSHPETNEIAKIEETDYGTKSVVVCNLQTPDGRNPCIRSVWMLEKGSTIQRFVTAYRAEDTN